MTSSHLISTLSSVGLDLAKIFGAGAGASSKTAKRSSSSILELSPNRFTKQLTQFHSFFNCCNFGRQVRKQLKRVLLFVYSWFKPLPIGHEDISDRSSKLLSFKSFKIFLVILKRASFWKNLFMEELKRAQVYRGSGILGFAFRTRVGLGLMKARLSGAGC